MPENANHKSDVWIIHLVWLCILGIFFFVDRDDHQTTLKELSSIAKQAETTMALANELKENADHFDDEDWREVAPIVREKAEELEVATAFLSTSISELKDTLTPRDSEPGDRGPW